MKFVIVSPSAELREKLTSAPRPPDWEFLFVSKAAEALGALKSEKLAAVVFDTSVADLDRIRQLAQEGYYVGIDHLGWEATGGPTGLPDAERIRAIQSLLADGLGDRILVSSSARGVAVDFPAASIDFAYLLKAFVPALRQAGVGEDQVATLLESNPARALGL